MGGWVGGWVGRWVGGWVGRWVGCDFFVPNDEHAIKEVDRDAVGREDVRGASDGADAAVGGKDDDRGEGGFQGAVEVGEAFNVQHVHLVDKEDAGHQLGHALINVPIHHPVHLVPQLLRDLCLFGLH